MFLILRYKIQGFINMKQIKAVEIVWQMETLLEVKAKYSNQVIVSIIKYKMPKLLNLASKIK